MPLNVALFILFSIDLGSMYLHMVFHIGVCICIVRNYCPYQIQYNYMVKKGAGNWYVQFHFAVASWHPVQDFNILTNRYLEHHEACRESFDLYDEIHWDNS